MKKAIQKKKNTKNNIKLQLLKEFQELTKINWNINSILLSLDHDINKEILTERNGFYLKKFCYKRRVTVDGFKLVCFLGNQTWFEFTGLLNRDYSSA